MTDAQPRFNEALLDGVPNRERSVDRWFNTASFGSGSRWNWSASRACPMCAARGATTSITLFKTTSLTEKLRKFSRTGRAQKHNPCPCAL